MDSKSSREIKESMNKDTQGWGMVNWEKISYKRDRYHWVKNKNEGKLVANIQHTSLLS